MPNVADELAASRRPLNSRQWGWTARTATRLARAGVTPNAISLFSIACTAFAACGFAITRYATSPWLDAFGYLIAIAGIQSRLLCNLFDGRVAIEGGHRTPAGELFNETSDRVADTLILVAAGYAADPVYGPTLGWLAALLAMATAYVRVLGKACGAGTYFVGPMAKQQRMAVVSFACALNVVSCLSFPSWLPPLGITIRQITGRTMTSWLVIICLGCIPTLCRRLACIAADLNAKAVR